MKYQIISKNPKQTFNLGKRLAKHLRPQDIICLSGPLGSGKTVLTKGMAQGLGMKGEAVSSPTFTFLNIYEGKKDLYHFDLYRVDKAEDLQALGVEEFLYGQGICVVEWAEKLEHFFPRECLEVNIAHQDKTSRQLSFCAKGKRAQTLLKVLFP